MSRYGLIGYPLAGSDSPRLFGLYCGKSYDLLEEKDFDRAREIFLRDYDAVNVTSPFKRDAFLSADIQADSARRTGVANILVKTPDGVEAHNSDYLAVKKILTPFLAPSIVTAAVIGLGGAGKAAAAACEDMGLEIRCYHHDEISDGVEADVIIYTLPKDVPGTQKLHCHLLVEANYKTPCLKAADFSVYIGGEIWLREQAIEGYPLMCEGQLSFPLALTGFMGCGKSTLAEELVFEDTDKVVGNPAEIIRQSGEQAFRRIEEKALEVLRGRNIVTGGGTITDDICRKILLENWDCIYLKTSIETLKSRLGPASPDRPLLQNPAELFLQRKSVYELCPIIIDTDKFALAGLSSLISSLSLTL